MLPGAQDLRRGETGFGLLRPENAEQQFTLDDTLTLVNPECFDEMVLVVGIGRIETTGPLLQGRDDKRLLPTAEFGAHQISGVILVLLQLL